MVALRNGRLRSPVPGALADKEGWCVTRPWIHSLPVNTPAKIKMAHIRSLSKHTRLKTSVLCYRFLKLNVFRTEMFRTPSYKIDTYGMHPVTNIFNKVSSISANEPLQLKNNRLYKSSATVSFIGNRTTRKIIDIWE